jgi:hypothetical protein
MALDNLDDDTIAGVRAKSEIYEQLVASVSFLNAKLLADTWCAAFVWRKDSLYDYPITEEVFRRVENNPQTLGAATRNEIEHLAGEYHFFHWPPRCTRPSTNASCQLEQRENSQVKAWGSASTPRVDLAPPRS